MKAENNVINHEKLNLADKIWVIAELEHLRRHARRSHRVAEDEEDKVFWGVVARQSTELRRDYQRAYLDSDELGWCATKVAATLKQLNYECEDDPDLFERIEDLTDMVLSHTLDEDLSGCVSCRTDKDEIE